MGSLARLGAFFIDSIFILIAMGAIIGFGKTGNDAATVPWVFAAGMFGYYTLCYTLAKRTFGEAAIKPAWLPILMTSGTPVKPSSAP